MTSFSFTQLSVKRGRRGRWLSVLTMGILSGTNRLRENVPEVEMMEADVS